jgi:glycosyltransferase involved in cell wall biosynthesis
MNPAPILLFAYNRLDTLKQTIQSLKANELASQSPLFIFSDAPKSEKHIEMVTEVRNYTSSVSGFKSVTVIEAQKNLGLANSIIAGVTRIINESGVVIVLEDDLVLTPNFLTFMNSALSKYEGDPLVFSVSGFIFDMKIKKDYQYDAFFTKRHCSWGWAMWKDRWNEIDWNVSDFSDFANSKEHQQRFDELGSDLSSSLKRQMKGEINSWAVRCNYHQFKKQTYTVYPIVSKVDNLGFGSEATHTTQRFNKYKTTLETNPKYNFKFQDQVVEDRFLLSQFTKKYSVSTRLWYYFLNTIFK